MNTPPAVSHPLASTANHRSVSSAANAPEGGATTRSTSDDQASARWIVITTLVAIGALILFPFIVPIAWAALVVFLTWPIYRRLTTVLSATLAALVMVLLVVATVVVPMAAIAIHLREDVTTWLSQLASSPENMMASVHGVLSALPWVGNNLAERFDALVSSPGALRRWISEAATAQISVVGGMATQAGQILFAYGIFLLTAFFLYRDGGELIRHVRNGVRRAMGPRAIRVVDAAEDIIKAVVVGMLVSAIAQALVGGASYVVVGAPNILLLTIVTGVAALLPFGPIIVWAPLAVWLAAHDQWWSAIGIAAWGSIVVSSVDNLVRPWAISAKTEIHFLVITFGVIGGGLLFGLLGLFIGPVVLALLALFWREWLASSPSRLP